MIDFEQHTNREVRFNNDPRTKVEHVLGLIDWAIALEEAKPAR